MIYLKPFTRKKNTVLLARQRIAWKTESGWKEDMLEEVAENLQSTKDEALILKNETSESHGQWHTEFAICEFCLAKADKTLPNFFSGQKAH